MVDDIDIILDNVAGTLIFSYRLSDTVTKSGSRESVIYYDWMNSTEMWISGYGR